MSQTSAFGAHASDQPLASLAIERREPGPRDVAIDILYCGVCHSDLHTVRGEWGGTVYPLRPRATRSSAGSPPSAREVDEASRSATSPASAAWSTPAAPARPARKAWSSICENGITCTYGGAEKETGGRHLRRLLERHRRRRGLRPARPRRPRPRRRRAAALRRHHHLLAAAPLERRPGQAGRRRRARRARPHGA